jgi:hypothetical protein
LLDLPSDTSIGENEGLAGANIEPRRKSRIFILLDRSRPRYCTEYFHPLQFAAFRPPPHIYRQQWTLRKKPGQMDSPVSSRASEEVAAKERLRSVGFEGRNRKKGGAGATTNYPVTAFGFPATIP